MSMKLLLRKLHMRGNEFLKSDELKGYCNTLSLDYDNTVRYFISRGYLLRIFRGVFYVRSFDELKLGKTKYSHLELVSKGLELKGVKNWYFGLYTALKLNNMTHEHFVIDYVISDKIFRDRPMKIAGYEFKFFKLKPALFSFGIIENRFRYSDIEKTILDFIYIWRYSSVPKEKILADLSGYTDNLSKKRIRDYVRNYPKTVEKIVEEML